MRSLCAKLILPFLCLTLASAAPDASVARLLFQIRHALGADRAAALGTIEIVDRDSSGQELVTLADPRTGAYRLGEESGFDGRYRWQEDARRSVAVPQSLRQHEKAAWPVWLRDHWWLRRSSGVEVAALPAADTATTIALALRRPGGVVGATVHVDRTTHLPVRLVVPYERGPFEARYSGWRRWRGVAIAGVVETSYRNTARVELVRIGPVNADRLAAGAAPTDALFDPTASALLSVRRAPEFAGGLRGHSFVSASVDGVEGWWLLDSGADGMLIDAALADRLHLTSEGESRSVGADGRPQPATWRRASSFHVGRLTFRGPVFRAVALAAATAPPGERRAGVIGYDVFARAVVEYGRDGDEIALCDPTAYRSPRAMPWQPLDFNDQTPAVPARVEGRYRGLFQVDTGAAGAVDFYLPFVEANRLLDGRTTTAVASSGSGGAFIMRAGRIASIELGGRRFTDIEAGFRTAPGRDGAGVVGRALMKPFRVVFDYPHRRIAFWPAARPGVLEDRCRSAR